MRTPTPFRDMAILSLVLFVGYALHFFPTTAPLVRLLELGPEAWRDGQIFRFVSYAFVGAVSVPLFYVIESTAVFLLGMRVATRFTRARLWVTLLWVGTAAGAVASVASLALGSLGVSNWQSLDVVQGQHTILAAFFGGWIACQGGRPLRLGGYSLRTATLVTSMLVVIGVVSVWRRDLAGGIGLVAAIVIFYGALVPDGIRGAFRHTLYHLRARFWRRRFEKMTRDHSLYIVRDRNDSVN